MMISILTEQSHNEVSKTWKSRRVCHQRFLVSNQTERSRSAVDPPVLQPFDRARAYMGEMYAVLYLHVRA